MNPCALIILDGFGYSKRKKGNAIAQAQTPILDYLFKNYPHTFLNASGTAVGLPDGYTGNSEVGHATIGAGRIVPSIFLQFEQSIKSGQFFKNKTFVKNINLIAHSNISLHIMGILSDAGNQGHNDVIKACIEFALNQGVTKIYIHAFLDGRDVLPISAARYLNEINALCIGKPVSIASITGRFFAMDRNNNWDRTLATFDMMTNQIKPEFNSWQKALAYYYDHGITDEFIPPTLLDPAGIIKPHDGVIFTNFRQDRARQLSACFVKPKIAGIGRNLPLSFFISTILYDDSFDNPVLFKKEKIKQTLKEVLSASDKSIFSIAETEKYAHITYFFAGEHEEPFVHEKTVLIPSLSHLKTYENHPCMSAPEITAAVIETFAYNRFDFYIINYANADMVGHSGNQDATIKAVECLDAQIKQLYESFIVKGNGMLFITADHGNAEQMIDVKTGQPFTEHTQNQVPFLWVKFGQEKKKIILPLIGLADIAPFILSQFNLLIPQVMTGSGITDHSNAK